MDFDHPTNRDHILDIHLVIGGFFRGDKRDRSLVPLAHERWNSDMVNTVLASEKLGE